MPVCGVVVGGGAMESRDGCLEMIGGCDGAGGGEGEMMEALGDEVLIPG